MDQWVRERLLLLNPWLEEPARFGEEVGRRLPARLVPRRLARAPAVERGKVRLVVGPRQAGKSTLVWSDLAGAEARSVLFILGEEPLLRGWASSPLVMMRDLDAELPSVRTLFFDELQHVDNAALMLKGLVDARRGYQIVATGSSSFHLMDRVRESLAGRATRQVLLPFSVAELAAEDAALPPAVARQRRTEVVRRMLVDGSYPGVWLAVDPRRELLELVEAFVLRDVSDRFRIQRPEAFRRLLQLLAGQIGQMLNLAELASHLGIAVSTVREYVNLLEETWIVRLLPPFAGGRRVEVTSAARVHFVDLGLRNAVLGLLDHDLERRPDLGALVEGLTFSELLKSVGPGWGLHYWRAKGGAEVDFVLVQGERRIAVEAKVHPRRAMSRSLRSFIAAYAPELVLIVTLAPSASAAQAPDDRRIRVVPLDQLGEEIAALTGGIDRPGIDRPGIDRPGT